MNKEKVSAKHRYLWDKLHVVTCQKTVMFLASVKTRDRIDSWNCCHCDGKGDSWMNDGHVAIGERMPFRAVVWIR